MICLIGASGSGKSTLLRCVNLLEPIDDGAIVLDGEDISDAGARPRPDPAADRDGVPELQPVPPPAGDRQRHAGAAQGAAHGVDGPPRPAPRELLGRFGLADKAETYPDRLSGGQQQRVAIVRSLAMDPEVMLLDEITSALDPELVGEVLDVVRGLKADGMTMVLATHEMSFAREIADRVCFLDAGRILEDGPPDAIFGAPREPRTRAFLQRVVDAGRM